MKTSLHFSEVVEGKRTFDRALETLLKGGSMNRGFTLVPD